MITIRAAIPKDIEILRRFEQGVVSAERPLDATLKPGAIQYHDIEAMLASDKALFLIAESMGTPVGCGFARIEAAKPYVRHTLQAYLGLMYVEPEFRSRGVNRQILEALKTWCSAQGVSELRLEVYSDNVVAIGAYIKAGFKPRMLEMSLHLPMR